jgi:hypothetical protein
VLPGQSVDPDELGEQLGVTVTVHNNRDVDDLLESVKSPKKNTDGTSAAAIEIESPGGKIPIYEVGDGLINAISLAVMDMPSENRLGRVDFLTDEGVVCLSIISRKAMGV